MSVVREEGKLAVKMPKVGKDNFLSSVDLSVLWQILSN